MTATTRFGLSYNTPQTNVVGLTILIHGRDQRDQPIVFDAVRVTLGCMSEIMVG